jgi:hypothetical protein
MALSLAGYPTGFSGAKAEWTGGGFDNRDDRLPASSSSRQMGRRRAC